MGWIPISKQLPQFAERVLIYCEGGYIFVGRCDLFNNEIMWMHNSMLKSEDKVTHWSILPDPPNNV